MTTTNTEFLPRVILSIPLLDEPTTPIRELCLRQVNENTWSVCHYLIETYRFSNGQYFKDELAARIYFDDYLKEYLEYSQVKLEHYQELLKELPNN